MSEWISISDRLPEEGQKVWFWLVPKPIEERKDICVWKRALNSNGDPIPTANCIIEPYKDICVWKGWSSIMKPTHWQPLPAPPEKEDEEK